SIVTVAAATGSIALPAPTPAAPGSPGPEHTATRTFAGLLARDPGEFVGRRAEQHDLPALLTTGDRPGAVLHGIGGVGPTHPAPANPPPPPPPAPRRILAAPPRPPRRPPPPTPPPRAP